MSKKQQKSPPQLYFSGAMSATLRKRLSQNLFSPRIPEQCRPLSNHNRLQYNAFRSIVGQQDVKSPNFATNETGKVLWQEQS